MNNKPRLNADLLRELWRARVPTPERVSTIQIKSQGTDRGGLVRCPALDRLSAKERKAWLENPSLEVHLPGNSTAYERTVRLHEALHVRHTIPVLLENPAIQNDNRLAHNFIEDSIVHLLHCRVFAPLSTIRDEVCTATQDIRTVVRFLKKAPALLAEARENDALPIAFERLESAAGFAFRAHQIASAVLRDGSDWADGQREMFGTRPSLEQTQKLGRTLDRAAWIQDNGRRLFIEASLATVPPEQTKINPDYVQHVRESATKAFDAMVYEVAKVVLKQQRHFKGKAKR